jgi:hypothetical protein
MLNQEQKGLSGDPQRLDDVFPGGGWHLHRQVCFFPRHSSPSKKSAKSGFSCLCQNPPSSLTTWKFGPPVRPLVGESAIMSSDHNALSV